MRKLWKHLKNDSGQIMIESTLVVVFTIIVLLAMISVGFLIYQQAMLNTVACEIASGVADSYKYDQRTIFCVEEISKDAINGIDKYRATFCKGSMEKKLDLLAEDYAEERIKATSFGFNSGKLTVDTKIKFNNVGRMRAEVTLKQKSNILFDGALIGLGLMDEPMTFTAHAAAECLDITAYASGVKFSSYIKDKFNDMGAITDIGNGIVTTITNIKDTIAILYD